jgi:serine/threonine protein kinase
VYNYEVSLVLEYCDKGSLRVALDARAFLLPAPGGGAGAAAAATTAAATAAAAAAAAAGGGDAAAAGGDAAASYGGLNYKAVLDTAADVARAMLHLHQQQVVHADLKARNILLKSDGGEGRGVVAKVADFGLAVRIDAAGGATHVSEFRGTQTHMAPEAQLAARVSKAGDGALFWDGGWRAVGGGGGKRGAGGGGNFDSSANISPTTVTPNTKKTVYAFGITCWELLTGGHAFDDVPMALLGHRVAVQGARPEMPEGAPADFRRLVEACWAGEPEHRWVCVWACLAAAVVACAPSFAFWLPHTP